MNARWKSLCFASSLKPFPRLGCLTFTTGVTTLKHWTNIVVARNEAKAVLSHFLLLLVVFFCFHFTLLVFMSVAVLNVSLEARV